MSNHADPGEVLDELLEEPFANWHVETTTHTHQLRVTKKGQALLHSAERTEQAAPDRSHDQTKERLLPEDHPVLVALGISDRQGRVKPSRQAKYRQVEEFLRALSAAIDDAQRSGKLRTPTDDDPLRVVDLGCGNAYLTFAAHAWLREQLPVQAGRRRRQGAVAAAQHRGGRVARRRRRADLRRRRASATSVLEEPPDVVLALHACDTATDDALLRAVDWEADLVLAAPCCHHDISAQLRRGSDSGGLHQFDPRRDFAGATGRYLDRRPARGDPATGWLSRGRRRVRRKRAHAAQHVAACGAHRLCPPRAGSRGVRRSWCPRGTCTRSWPSCWRGGIRSDVARRNGQRACRACSRVPSLARRLPTTAGTVCPCATPASPSRAASSTSAR